jgi:hypothetical protein
VASPVVRSAHLPCDVAEQELHEAGEISLGGAEEQMNMVRREHEPEELDGMHSGRPREDSLEQRICRW